MISHPLGVMAIAGHGLMHLPGVVILWCLWQPGTPLLAAVGPAPGTSGGIAVGGLLIASALLFALAGSSLRSGRTWWHRILLAAVVVSGAALLPSASMPVAAVGLVIDWIALVVVIMASERATQRGALEPAATGATSPANRVLPRDAEHRSAHLPGRAEVGRQAHRG